MKIEPLGFYVLVEMDEIKNISEGGIILPEKETAREQEGCDFGTIKAFGPVAYDGFPGCDKVSQETHDKTAPQLWGLAVGDRVEYRRYEGKLSNVPGMDRCRYIPDSHIIGRIQYE